MQPFRTSTPAPRIGVLHHGEGANAALRPDARLPEQLHERLDDRIRGYLHRGIDDAGFRPENRHAGSHQAARCFQPHSRIEVHHLGNRVGAEHLIHAVGLDGDNALSVGS